LKGITLNRVNAPTTPTSEATESLFLQLRDELPKNSADKAAIAMVGGSKARIGDLARYRINSDIEGRLIVIDINAHGRVSQIFPNHLSGRKRVSTGEQFFIPENDRYRLRIREPKGRGKVVALVVPENFNMKALETLQERTIAVEQVLPYFQNLIELVRIARGTKTVSVEMATQSIEENWGLGKVDYEVID
jgi:hypothetical protein